MKVVRRIGSTPRERGSATGQSCPDVFELDNGEYAVIGYDDRAPDGIVLGPGEYLVVVPRELLVDAKKDIPDE